MNCEFCNKEFPPNRYDGSGNRYCISCLKLACDRAWEKIKKEKEIEQAQISVFNCGKCSGRTFVFEEPAQCYYCKTLIFEKIKGKKQ